MTDEAALVAAARAAPGGSGFTAIYQRYADRIHDYCLAVLRHREDAADAAQDTFLIAYQRLDQLRDPARLTPWLYAIARSRCLRRIADRKRQRPVDDLEQVSPPQPAATGEVERGELRRLVWDAAAGLAPADRAVLDLHLRQGLSGADLADALGVPAEKANLMLHRTRQRMGRTIGALLVARAGRGHCPDLDAIAGGELTPLIRKRLARHIDRCQACLARRDRLAPELVYASVPLVPAPLALGDRLLEQLPVGATTAPDGTPPATDGTPSVADRMRWGADGFPRPGGAGAPVPLPRRLAVGGGIAGLVALGLLGGFVTGRTIGGTPPAEAPPVAVATASRPATPAPGSVPGPAAGSPGPTTVPTQAPGPAGSAAPTPPTPSAPASTPTPTAPADLAPPVLSPLRLGDCGLTLTAEVDVTDAIDPAPTANLMLSWDAGPGGPVQMLPAGGGTYRATMQRVGDARGFVTFTASGTVTDNAGNTAFRSVSRSCTPIVD
jgi:RNA polymerase sigma factor (sigma-70 family)